jgi:hypothetical protein
VLYRLVEAPAMAMINPLLVDQQFSLTEIRLLISVGGAGTGMLAAVGAAWLLKQRRAEQLLMHAGWWRTVLYVLLALMLYSGAMATSRWGLGALVIALLALRYVAMTSLYACSCGSVRVPRPAPTSPCWCASSCWSISSAVHCPASSPRAWATPSTTSRWRQFRRSGCCCAGR